MTWQLTTDITSALAPLFVPRLLPATVVGHCITSLVSPATAPPSCARPASDASSASRTRPDPMASSAVTTNTAPRRGTSTAAGEWAAVSVEGLCTVEEFGSRHQLMRRTGLPARDLRALAAASSCPSGGTVTARDRALVVNLDRARAVVTAAEALVPGPRDATVAPLVRHLRERLASASPMAADCGRQLESDGKVLPFEFRALEVCLEFACNCLEHETSTLEKEAYPALDELSSKVSTLNLERVRQIKSRLVAISGRVQKVRDELEHLLDDDMDMAAMHLTEKLAYQAAEHSSRYDDESEPSGVYKVSGDGPPEAVNGSDDNSVRFSPKIDELESLLEAYFVQIDGTLNKLCTLREYVDDTEDYINIMLDDKQNQLLQMGIVLSTGTLVVSCAIAAAGVLGMNIRIPLYDDATAAVFWQTTGGIVGAGAAIYLLALLCYRRSGILQ